MEREEGGVDLYVLVCQYFSACLKKIHRDIFSTQKELAWKISVDSEQLWNLWQNLYLPMPSFYGTALLQYCTVLYCTVAAVYLRQLARALRPEFLVLIRWEEGDRRMVPMAIHLSMKILWFSRKWIGMHCSIHPYTANYTFALLHYSLRPITPKSDQSHSVKNLAFHSLLTWKMITCV